MLHKPFAALACAGMIAASAGSVQAIDTKGAELLEGKALRALDLPARQPIPGTRADTVCFGYVQTISGALYAVPGEAWTFDHGAGGAEGWYAVDLTENLANYFRRIDAATWAGHGNGPAPILSGAASAWVGAFHDEGDALCWEARLGYGDHWRQSFESPALTYSGGDVALSFKYFADSEPGYDVTRVLLRIGAQDVPLNGAGYSGVLGAPNAPSTANLVIPAASFGAATFYHLVFDFTSDAGVSDQDGLYDTFYGPFGFDDLVATDAGGTQSFDFESGSQGWVAHHPSGVGAQFGIADASEYTLLGSCACGLTGNVLEAHAGFGNAGTHPLGQHEQIFSPPADLSGLGNTYNQVSGSWDIYADMPLANGVFFRAGWNYYPYVCYSTGVTMWSGRAGSQMQYQWVGDAGCARQTVSATDQGIPQRVERIGLVFEIYASCDAFGISPSACSGVTNFSPLFDNVRICATAGSAVPVIALEPGGAFQDGFGHTPAAYWNSTTNAGNADCTFDLHRDGSASAMLGDSLVISGPLPTASTKWSATMWFRIPREGPGILSAYTNWKNAVRDGLNIVGPNAQFAFGYMDSVQTAPFAIARNKFASEFKENDDDFAGENTSNNEIIRDGILTPGTQVQYFITANFACTPSVYYYLPDTTGGNFFDFEILPSFRMINGQAKLPCILTINVSNEERYAVEHALNVVLNGATIADPIPNPTRWDRYDYADATSNWNGPLIKSDQGGNSGMFLEQMLNYRGIVLYTGDTPVPTMEPADFAAFDEWLTAIRCEGNSYPQGFLAAGDNAAKLIQTANAHLAAATLGTQVLCDAYHQSGCGPSAPSDESDCVRINAATGAAFAPLSDADVGGNWCPQARGFDVLGPVSGGIGNRAYEDYDRTPPLNTNYAQVVKAQDIRENGRYRAVINGYSLGSLSARDVLQECVADDAHNVPAVAEELRASLRWMFQGDANVPTYCPGATCTVAVDDGPAGGVAGVTRLFENRPNPFAERTAIRFSIGNAGSAELVIYDVGGRAVRKLASGPMSAGEHTVVWDGTDDHGRRLSAGVYWSQLRAGGYESQRKMLLMK